MKAFEIANELFEKGHYQNFKKYEEEKKVIEAQAKILMNGEKRICFEQYNVVMKNVADNRYITNNKELNEFLDSLGILVPVAKIDTKEQHILNQIKHHKNPEEYYIRINTKIEKEKYDFSDYNLEQLAQRWNEVNKLYKEYKGIIEEAKLQMLQCNELDKTKKVAFEYGSISKIKKQDTYNIKGIYEEFGSEFIINNCKASITELEPFIEQGYLSKSDINQYRNLYTTGLKFIVMTLEDENNISNFLIRRASTGSINRELLKRQVLYL